VIHPGVVRTANGWRGLQAASGPTHPKAPVARPVGRLNKDRNMAFLARPPYRALALLAVLASPAAAQDADPENQLIEGYMVCALTNGDPAAVTTNLGIYGWKSEDGEDGLITVLPGVGDSTVVQVAKDCSFCQVESMVRGMARAAEIMAMGRKGAGQPEPETDTNAEGCTRYHLSGGVVATLTSGGNDPVCASDESAAFRFEFSAKE